MHLEHLFSQSGKWRTVLWLMLVGKCMNRGMIVSGENKPSRKEREKHTMAYTVEVIVAIFDSTAVFIILKTLTFKPVVLQIC